MQYNIQPATREEIILFYSSTDSSHDKECGCIGHLRGYFDSRDEFITTFFDHLNNLKTQSFKIEFDALVNQLRTKNGLLNSLSSMSAYCYAHPKAKSPSWNDCTYYYRAATDSHSYYIRCSVARGDYNSYIYCYCREQLEQFLEKGKTKGGIDE